MPMQMQGKRFVGITVLMLAVALAACQSGPPDRAFNQPGHTASADQADHHASGNTQARPVEAAYQPRSCSASARRDDHAAFPAAHGQSPEAWLASRWMRFSPTCPRRCIFSRHWLRPPRPQPSPLPSRRLRNLPPRRPRRRPCPNPPMASRRSPRNTPTWLRVRLGAMATPIRRSASLSGRYASGPNRPILLRLLGRIYTEAGNKVRGAMYLKQAVQLDPKHIPSVAHPRRIRA